MLRSTERGLYLSEWDNLTVGMIMDYITFYNNEYFEVEKNEEVRQATQADFDRF